MWQKSNAEGASCKNKPRMYKFPQLGLSINMLHGGTFSAITDQDLGTIIFCGSVNHRISSCDVVKILPRDGNDKEGADGEGWGSRPFEDGQSRRGFDYISGRNETIVIEDYGSDCTVIIHTGVTAHVSPAIQLKPTQATTLWSQPPVESTLQCTVSCVG
jgi:hypothetical protein